MDLKSLIAKMDQIEQGLNEADAAAPAAAPAADPARAQYDKFKADDDKSAAIEAVKKMTQPNGMSNFIDPKDGVIKYQEQGAMGGAGSIKEFSYDWYKKGQEKGFFDQLKAAGLEVIPVERKSLFGTFQVAGVDPQKLATLGQTPAGGNTAGGDSAALLKQLQELMALIDQYAALKAKKAAGGATPAAGAGAAAGGAGATQGVAKPAVKEGMAFKSDIAKGLVESFGLNFNEPAPEGYYYDTNGQLVEYSMAQFGQDAGDFGRGAWNGLTLGTGDNIVAGVKSAFGPGTYKDELKKQTQASLDAEKRSPGLYTAGNIAGSVAAPIPGGAAVAGLKGVGTLGKLALQGGLNYAAQKGVDVVKDKADLKTLGGGKGNPQIQQLQKTIGVVPDGLMGPKTKKALMAWQTQQGLPATGAADPATLKAAGISESGETMNKNQTVAESIRSLQNRLAMLENKKDEDENEYLDSENDEQANEEYEFTEDELNEEIFVDESGNYYKSNGEQITDEGILDAIGKGIGKFQKGVSTGFNKGALSAGTAARAGIMNKAGNAVGRVGKTIAKNPGKSIAAAAGLGALAGNMAAGGGGTTTPVTPPHPGPKPPKPNAGPDAAGGAEDPELAELRAKIEKIMSDLAQNPDPAVQKGLVDARAKWSQVTGDKNIGSADKPQASNATANTTGGPNMGQVNPAPVVQATGDATKDANAMASGNVVKYK